MNNMSVAIIFFIRPDKLAKVFDAVRKAKPDKLFLIQDGPRDDSDISKIEECRKIVDNVDWPCKVFKNYASKNLGCGLRPSTGITWAFKHTDKLIILEDDCVPNQSFFPFCQKLLLKYEHNNNIKLISGMNLLDQYDTKDSFIFSRVCTIGAWATWKRVWDNYDFEIKSFDNKNIRNSLKTVIKYPDVIKQKFWAWDLTREKAKHQEKIEWWDYQFHFMLYKDAGLGIIPSKNLIQNIGYGEGASNVSDKDAAVHFNLKTYEMDKKLKAPKSEECNYEFDRKVYDLQNIKVNSFRVFLSKIKRFLIRCLGGKNGK